ncbi:MAG: putative membrane protein [Saprospiraceae bacterium]|jgi:uncharacterized membrane protein
MLPWHQYLLGLMFVIAGANHFRTPNIYERIMPPYIPSPSFMVLLSGITEMVAGFLVLNPQTQILGAWSIIAQLVVFLSVHIHMLQNKEASLKLPKWVLILRIPLQFGMMYWAYQYVVA